MSVEANKYKKAGYKTGDGFVFGLRKIAESHDGDLQKALRVALDDLEASGSHEHVESTEEAYRWLRNNSGQKE